jgi:hypothetical protein
MVTVPANPDDGAAPASELPLSLLPQAVRAPAADNPATTSTQMLRFLFISLPSAQASDPKKEPTVSTILCVYLLYVKL